MFFVYAIKSLITNRVYIGHSNNWHRRLKEHNSGVVKSTKKDRPWELIAVQEFNSRNKARWKERQMKKSKGSKDKWIIEFAYPPACKPYGLEAGSDSQISYQAIE